MTMNDDYMRLLGLAQYSAQNAGMQNAHANGVMGRALGVAANQYQGVGASMCLTCGQYGLHTHEIKTKQKEEAKVENGPWKWFSNYVEKHKDMIFTVALILLADHYLFAGKFRAKIEDMVESWISKATKAVKADA